VSVLATAALIHLLVVPLNKALPPMILVNKAVAGGSNNVKGLLEFYWNTGKELLERTYKREIVLGAAAIIAALSRGKTAQRGASLLAVYGIALAYFELESHHSTTGGVRSLQEFPSGLIGAAFIAFLVGVVVVFRDWVAQAIAWVRDKLAGRGDGDAQCESQPMSSLSRDGIRGIAMFALLASVPITQAAGTGNPLYQMAINGFAAWMAIMVAILTGIDAASRAARWVTMAVAAGAILLSASIGSSGVRDYPYRTVGLAQATDVAGGVPALSSLRLSSADAAGYSHLHWLLQPYIDPPGRAIAVFDESAGFTLLLDGQPIGEAWYSYSDRARIAAGIRWECEGKTPFWGSRPPLFLFRRAVLQSERDALQACGLSLERDYRLLPASKETMEIQIYVPANEAKDR
jgi:hypothetical protein